MTAINITLTEEAVKHLTSLIEEMNQENAFLRVWVAGGGCSGLTYGMALDDSNEPDDIVIEQHGIKIAIDPLSSKYLDGSTVEYKDDLLGGGFKISNPNATSSCGCGNSFKSEETPQSSNEQSCQGCRRA